MPIETAVITENPVSAWEQFHQTLVQGRDFSNEQITHRDMGGFWQASFDYIPHDREDALQFLNNALGRSITFYNEAGNISWEGFINTVTMRTGTATIKNSLNDMANKVWVRYTPVGGGNVARSTVVEDAVSQARFGIKEQVIAGGEISNAVADQLAQAYLDLHFWPFPALDSIDLLGTPLAQPAMQVVCYGWFRTLEWRVYNQTVDPGTQNAGQQIQDIIGTPGDVPGSLKADLEAWWTLDEESAGAAPVTRDDSSGNDNHLTDNGTVASIAGRVELAGDFVPAQNTFLSIVDNASLSFADEDFTIACWAYVDAKAGNMRLVGKWDFAAGDREYVLQYGVALDRYMLGVSSNGVANTVIVANTFGAPGLGAWQFLIAWHDSVADTLSIQINDGGIDSVGYALGCNDNISPLGIGANPAGPGDLFDGRIDEPAIWRRVLTATERTAIYNSGAGVSYSNLGDRSLVGGVAQFINSATIQGNSTSVTKEYDADRKAADICTAIADLGNEDFRAVIVGCEEDRAFYYKEAAPPVRSDV